jgi:hypothetical protein
LLNTKQLLRNCDVRAPPVLLVERAQTDYTTYWIYVDMMEAWRELAHWREIEMSWEQKEDRENPSFPAGVVGSGNTTEETIRELIAIDDELL